MTGITYAAMLEAVIRAYRQDLAAAERSRLKVWIDYASTRLAEAEDLLERALTEQSVDRGRR